MQTEFLEVSRPPLPESRAPRPHSPSPPGPAESRAAAKFKPRGHGARNIAGGCARSATDSGRALRLDVPLGLRLPLGMRWPLQPPRFPGAARLRPACAAPPRLPAGAAHEPALAARRHQVIPPGSVHDWPALSAGFACQWHGTKDAQRLEDPGRIGALSAVLGVFK